jgi:UDP-galactopyranose mutase
MQNVDYLIIGAGPAGLGAAHRLKELGISSFLIVEAGDTVGGLSASYQDNAGFTWDVGGHVLFSSDDRFIKLIDNVMDTDLLAHQRTARVRVAGQWTDYPFQDHIHQLVPELAWRCMRGLRKARGPGEKTHSFKDWIEHSFGEGITELFMTPYNHKLWAFPLELLGFQWINDRISTVHGKTAGQSGAWGPNSEFRYPRDGGIGAIFVRIAGQVDDRVLLRHEVVGINLDTRVAMTGNGKVYRYKALLNTAPLDRLIKKIIRSDRAEIIEAAEQLKHNSVSIVGLGLDAKGDRTTSWMYFADAQYPFYRLTYLHNYAPTITPIFGRQSALMAEVAFPQGRREDEATLIQKVIEGLIAAGILSTADRAKIISTWYTHAAYGYPIPTLDRDRALATIQPYLEAHQVFSRGRFGGWRYEVGNMDHAFMQGVEWADRMIKEMPESVYSTRLDPA